MNQLVELSGTHIYGTGSFQERIGVHDRWSELRSTHSNTPPPGGGAGRVISAANFREGHFINYSKCRVAAQVGLKCHFFVSVARKKGSFFFLNLSAELVDKHVLTNCGFHLFFEHISRRSRQNTG